MLSAMICARTSSKSGDRGAVIVVEETRDIKKGIYRSRPLGGPGGYEAGWGASESRSKLEHGLVPEEISDAEHALVIEWVGAIDARGRVAGACHLDRLVDLRRGRVQTQRARLIKLPHGRFDGHHGGLARLLLDQIDTPLVQFGNHRARIRVKLIFDLEGIHCQRCA